MLSLKRGLIAGFFLLSNLSSHIQAAIVINFEERPNGNTPADDADLVNPYVISGGSVRFFFDTNGNNSFDARDQFAKFERAGQSASDTESAFLNAVTGVDDQALNPTLANQLGDWFLRQQLPLDQATDIDPFIVDYDTTEAITALSGEIWDIDGNANGTELWRVEVYNNAGSRIAELMSPLGTTGSGPATLNARPWVFGFSELSDVDFVKISFLGSKTAGIGFAFNNFSADTNLAAVPEPSSICLLAIGLTIVAMIRWRKRSAQTSANTAIQL